MSKLYIYLSPTPEGLLTLDIITSMLAGGYTLPFHEVQPVLYEQPHAPRSPHIQQTMQHLEQSAEWTSPFISINAPLALSASEAQDTQSSAYCHGSCEYEILSQQVCLMPSADDVVLLLVQSVEQLRWPYAARAAFGMNATIGCVWQMPNQAYANAQATIKANYQSQLDTLQDIMSTMCTGLRADANTHHTYSLVETAATILYLAESLANETPCTMQCALSNKGNYIAYTPQSLPSTKASVALQRVALWQLLLKEELIEKCLKRLSIQSFQRIGQAHPTLAAISSIALFTQQWAAQLGTNSFVLQTDDSMLNQLAKDMNKQAPALSVDITDAERQTTFLKLLTKGIEDILPTDNIDEVHFSTIQYSNSTSRSFLTDCIFESPTKYFDLYDQAFAPIYKADATASAIRHNCLSLWHLFFAESEQHTNLPNLGQISEVALDNENTHSLLSFSSSGRYLLKHKWGYLIHIDTQTWAFTSPLTGFCCNASQLLPFAQDQELHHYELSFIRFIKCYASMFKHTFSDNFRQYLNTEIALLNNQQRTAVESVRPNVMTEFSSFTHHIGIDQFNITQ